jgi:hypothetical protein
MCCAGCYLPTSTRQHHLELRLYKLGLDYASDLRRPEVRHVGAAMVRCFALLRLKLAKQCGELRLRQIQLTELF